MDHKVNLAHPAMKDLAIDLELILVVDDLAAGRSVFEAWMGEWA